MIIRTALTLAAVNPDTGLRSALGQAPAEVIEEVSRSGIRGRGGAGFRTGLKWKLASEAPNSATKKVLNEIVTVLKYESSQKNVKALGLYVAKNQKYWVKASKSLATAIISCAKSLA